MILKIPPCPPPWPPCGRPYWSYFCQNDDPFDDATITDYPDDEFPLDSEHVSSQPINLQKSEKLEQVYPEQRALSKMIVEEHIVSILKDYHDKNLADFKDVDFQVYFFFKRQINA